MLTRRFLGPVGFLGWVAVELSSTLTQLLGVRSTGLEPATFGATNLARRFWCVLMCLWSPLICRQLVRSRLRIVRCVPVRISPDAVHTWSSTCARDEVSGVGQSITKVGAGRVPEAMRNISSTGIVVVTASTICAGYQRMGRHVAEGWTSVGLTQRLLLMSAKVRRRNTCSDYNLPWQRNIHDPAHRSSTTRCKRVPRYFTLEHRLPSRAAATKCCPSSFACSASS